jgi:hypothetical protein
MTRGISYRIRQRLLALQFQLAYVPRPAITPPQTQARVHHLVCFLRRKRCLARVHPPHTAVDETRMMTRGISYRIRQRLLALQFQLAYVSNYASTDPGSGASPSVFSQAEEVSSESSPASHNPQPGGAGSSNQCSHLPIVGYEFRDA